MKIYRNIFDGIIAVENLFESWNAFRRGKMGKKDVAEFSVHAEKYIFELHRKLSDGSYVHSEYSDFFVHDPKCRHIHKACVRDRVVHQAIYSAITDIFEPTFIHGSYSCRVGKGTHRAVAAFEDIARTVTRNYTAPCYVLKCDVRRFFDSVDHAILLKILSRKIRDERAVTLFSDIVESFEASAWTAAGIPIGNVTSQIFANVYLNEFDQFVKHTLRREYYVRYADDFVILSPNRQHLEETVQIIEAFLWEKLRLRLHPAKISIRNFYQGVDFLGHVVFPGHKILRTKTKRGILRKLGWTFRSFLRGAESFEGMDRVFQSYFGIMSHANCYKLVTAVRERFWVYGVLDESGQGSERLFISRDTL